MPASSIMIFRPCLRARLSGVRLVARGLSLAARPLGQQFDHSQIARLDHLHPFAPAVGLFDQMGDERALALLCAYEADEIDGGRPAARKSVVEGKSVSVRVDSGGRRNLKKKKKKN